MKSKLAVAVLQMMFLSAALFIPAHAEESNHAGETEALQRIIKIEEKKQWVKICEGQRWAETAEEINDTIGDILMAVSISSITPATSFSSSTTTAQQECYEKHEISDATQRQLRFVDNTHDVLMEHAARGSGEHIRSLAALMGCSAAVYTEFGQLVRNQYGRLFPASGKDPVHTLFLLKSEMVVHETLSALCDPSALRVATVLD